MGFRGVPHLLALVALLPFAAAAAVIDVPGDQPSIAAGIAMASNGDTVQVAPGTWAGVDNVNLNLAGKAIAVLGAGPGQTVIDCGGTEQGFLLLGGETVSTLIEGFRIVNGSGGYGGGIRIESAAATLRGLSIEDCVATRGGGISIRYATDTVLLEDVVLARNSADSGGGCYAYQSDVAHDHVTAVANTAATYSAAFHVASGTSTFSHCLVAWNTGQSAVNGAVYTESFADCDFYSNPQGDVAHDWVELVGVNGNFAADPLFCDRAGGDYALHEASPCLGAGGERVGALGAGCDYPLAVLSGSIETADGLPIAAAAIDFDGGYTRTDAGGHYAIFLLPGWSGTVTPSHEFYLFEPASRSYANLQVSQPDQDFVGAHPTLVRVPADAPTLQAGLDAAAPGDTVLVAPGLYEGPDNRELDFGGKDVVLRGEAGAEATVLLNASNGVLVRFDGGEGPGAVLEDLTLRGIQGYCQAIVCADGATPTLRRLIVEDHLQPGGYTDETPPAGLVGSSLLVEDCLFRNNSAREGVARIGGGARVTGTRFENNIGTESGTVRVDGDALFERCVFANNIAQGYTPELGCARGRGGAVYATGGSFTDCLFVANEAGMCHGWSSPDYPGMGGAMYIAGGVNLTRCTFVDNVATPTDDFDAPGTTFYIRGGFSRVIANFEDCLVTGSGDGGAALYCDPGTALANFSCSLFWDNAGGNADGDCPDPVGANGNFAADPLFCDPGAGDFSLDADSPCLPANNACGVRIGAFGQGCGVTAAETLTPGALRLSGHPNPFNPSTQLSFALPEAAAVTLTVHDLAGRRVATLLEGAALDAGEQSLRWDGRLDGGGRATSGGYLARLVARGRTVSQKLVLLK